MHLEFHSPTVFKPTPPPLWYVTNGELTVGPVVTDLLRRGVEYGRVPDYCEVRAFRGEWRNLHSVREIAALHSKTNIQVPVEEQFEKWVRPVERIKSEGELCHTATWLALVATGAESAMFHYRSRGSGALVTRSVLGSTPTDVLGYALPQHDMVLQAAYRGQPVFGPPYGPVEDSLAMRFARSAGGVGAAAMIPFFVGNTLTAMLELSRPGHAFRRSDLRRAESIVWRALLKRHN